MAASTPSTIAFIDLDAQQRRIEAPIKHAIDRVLAHGQYISGPEVTKLEQALAAHCGAKHAIGCSSGTDAIVLALMAMDIGPGDAVFVPSFTFAATAEAVALVGATPVFVDCQPRTYNLDPASLDEAVAMIKTQGQLRSGRRDRRRHVRSARRLQQHRSGRREARPLGH